MRWRDFSRPAKACRADAFIDVDYSDLVRDPIAVVRRIYSQLGNELSSAAELRMRTFLESNSHAKHGRHSYSLADFGMNPEKLSERFSSYCTRYSRHSSDSNREPSGPRDPVSTAVPKTLLSQKSSKKGLTRRPLFLVKVESFVCTVEMISTRCFAPECTV